MRSLSKQREKQRKIEALLSGGATAGEKSAAAAALARVRVTIDELESCPPPVELRAKSETTKLKESLAETEARNRDKLCKEFDRTLEGRLENFEHWLAFLCEAPFAVLIPGLPIAGLLIAGLLWWEPLFYLIAFIIAAIPISMNIIRICLSLIEWREDRRLKLWKEYDRTLEDRLETFETRLTFFCEAVPFTGLPIAGLLIVGLLWWKPLFYIIAFTVATIPISINIIRIWLSLIEWREDRRL